MWGADVALSWTLMPTHMSPLGKKSWRSRVKVVEKGSPKEEGEKAKQKHNSFHIWLANDKWPCHVHWLRAHYIILQQEILSEKTLCCLKKSLGWIQLLKQRLGAQLEYWHWTLHFSHSFDFQRWKPEITSKCFRFGSVTNSGSPISSRWVHL